MSKTKSKSERHAGKDVEQTEHSSIVGGNANSTDTLENNKAVVQKIRNIPIFKPSYSTSGYIPK